MIQFRNKAIAILYCFTIFYFFAFSACSSIPRERKINNYIIVHTRHGDTLKSIANQYNNEQSVPWNISEFNKIDALDSGQIIGIPLKPFNPGGLKPTGYQTIPVLSYGNFSKNQSDKGDVTNNSFEEQMRYLQDNNFSPITLDQLLLFLNFTGQVPKKNAVILIHTTDKTVFEVAFPILKKYNFPAALFICPDEIGKKNRMTWKQIIQMSKNRINIQFKLKDSRYTLQNGQNQSFQSYFTTLKNKITRSAAIMEKKFNKKCKFFMYPSGNYDTLLISILKKQGFLAAFSDKNGSNPFFIDNYKLRCSTIHGKCDIMDFKNFLQVYEKIELK